MAFTPLVPAQINAIVTQGLGQEFQSTVVNDFTGAPVNLSAWVSLAAKIQALNPSPNTADVTIGTVTCSSTGVCSLVLATTDLASAALGSANLVIEGKPTSGDTLQVLATGILTLNGG